MTAPGAAGEPGGASAAFAITVSFELFEGAFPEFHRLVSENAASSVALEPGCLRFDVLTPEGAARPHVFLYEIYADRAAFERHLATDHYLAFDRRTQPLVRRKTVHSFRVIENAKSRAPA